MGDDRLDDGEWRRQACKPSDWQPRRATDEPQEEALVCGGQLAHDREQLLHLHTDRQSRLQR
jgi:hypothetical protein